MEPVKIGQYEVGSGQPIFITAEIGINHNGDINIAKKLIDEAVDNGCQAVKFQKSTIVTLQTTIRELLSCRLKLQVIKRWCPIDNWKLFASHYICLTI